jgi:hypothetical protein
LKLKRKNHKKRKSRIDDDDDDDDYTSDYKYEEVSNNMPLKRSSRLNAKKRVVLYILYVSILIKRIILIYVLGLRKDHYLKLLEMNLKFRWMMKK